MKRITGQERMADRQDLCGAAVQLARRVQALPGQRTYLLVLRKEEGRWLLSVVGEGKVEVCGKEAGDGRG